MSKTDRLSRRQYLIRRALLDGVRPSAVTRTIDDQAAKNPDWDMTETRTWNEWEATR